MQGVDVAELPDVLEDFKHLMVSRTSATTKVHRNASPPGASGKYLVYAREGGVPTFSNAVDRARIRLEAWGPNEVEAHLLALEARDVLFPPDRVTQGFVGRVRATFFTGMTDLTGPYWSPDPNTGDARYVMSFLAHYARAVT